MMAPLEGAARTMPGIVPAPSPKGAGAAALPPPQCTAVTHDASTLIAALMCERQDASKLSSIQRVSSLEAEHAHRVAEHLAAIKRAIEERNEGGGLFDCIADVLCDAVEALGDGRIADAVGQLAEGAVDVAQELGRDLEALATHPDRWQTVLFAAVAGGLWLGPVAPVYVVDQPDSLPTKALAVLGQGAVTAATLGGSSATLALSLSLHAIPASLGEIAQRTGADWLRPVTLGFQVAGAAVGIASGAFVSASSATEGARIAQSVGGTVGGMGQLAEGVRKQGLEARGAHLLETEVGRNRASRALDRALDRLVAEAKRADDLRAESMNIASQECMAAGFAASMRA